MASLVGAALLLTILKSKTTFAAWKVFKVWTQMCLGTAARKFLPTDVQGCSWAMQLLHPTGEEGQGQPGRLSNVLAVLEEALGTWERKSI